MADGGYSAPATVEEAVALLGRGDIEARAMAGGTDVLVQLHSDLIDPDLIVDLKRIAELRGISGDRTRGFRIGAAATGMELMDHKELAAAWPGVIEGVSLIGSIQVKGRATVAGNLCNASPAADSVPAMIAAGAVAVVAGPAGRREVPVERMAAGPGKTTLAKGEIVVALLLPPRSPRSGDCYMRLTPRTEMDIAVVGCGVNLTLDAAGTCTAARVALGAVAPTAILVPEAAAALVGTKVDEAALARMAAAASAACNPISDKRGTREYRIKTAAVMARRAAETALQRARGK